MAAEYGFVINVSGNSIAQMKEIEAAMAQLGVHAKTETEKVESSFAKMGEGMTEVFHNLKSLFLTGLGITALFEGWEFIENSKVAFEGLEQAVARVDTVLKSTRFKAGFTSEEIQDQASEISKGIVNKRPEILQTQGTLLSYSNIRGPIFEEITKATADFSAFFKTDMPSAARLLGRAFQDPLQGMNQLRKAGIVLTDEQKNQIKNLETQGNLLGAQEVLLGEIQKKFGGQASAYAMTDAGKIQVAAKQWEELQYSLGEIISRVEVSLIPSFTKVVTAIKMAFNSDVIQFFIAHLKDLVEWVLRLIPIWLAYKAVMMANTAITGIFAIENGILTVSMGELTAMTDGSTVAFEGFSEAIASTGIGALVVGLGLVVEKLISMNKEMNDAIEKKYKLTESNDDFKQAADSYSSIKERMAVFKSLSPDAKSSLAADVNNFLATQKNKIPVLLHRQLELDAGYNAEKAMNNKSFNGVFQSVTKEDKLHKDFDALNGNMKDLGSHFADVKQFSKILVEKGIKPMGYVPAGAGNGVKGSAINTSMLSGAKGGLGEARVINIHIDTVQKNIGVKDSSAEKDTAVQFLIRAINNMSYSQTSTM